MSRASDGTIEVRQNIAEVMTIAGESREAASGVLGASGELAKQAEGLTTEMAVFVDVINRVG
ncbi:hypothetical protein [Dongia mobilis]|uniref:hypothetical protein n=1 Tax=Dongia sp. TaxID=1977262 RepID=UPI0026EA11C6